MKRFFLPAVPALAVLLVAGSGRADPSYRAGVRPLYANPHGFRSGGIGYSYRAPTRYGFHYGYASGRGRLYSPSLSYRRGIYPGVGYRYSTLPGARYSPYRYGIDPALRYRAGGLQPYRYPSLATGRSPLLSPRLPDYTTPITPVGRASGSSAGSTSSVRRAFYPPDTLPPVPMASVPKKARALLTMRVPADAEIWFGDYKSKQTGAQRTFRTPLLEVGGSYKYKVRMRWTDQGKPREVTREITVRPGADRTIDLRNDEGK